MKNIVLIGLMGAGKTTSCKIISEVLGYPLIDTDELIEKNTKTTINEIFETKGEQYFRELETNTIKELSKKNGVIISTGGGVVENLINLELLGKNGIIFYLESTPEILYQRLKTDATRPLLKTENPLNTLKMLLAKRIRKYKLADYGINTDHSDFKKIADEIIEKYNEHKNS